MVVPAQPALRLDSKNSSKSDFFGGLSQVIFASLQKSVHVVLYFWKVDSVISLE